MGEKHPSNEGCFFRAIFQKGGERVGKLTEKQKRFADEYLIDLNGTRAYLAAYPKTRSEGTAAVAACRLLRNVRVKAYLDERLAAIQSKKTADATEVLETLTAIMRGEMTEEVPLLCGEGQQMLADKNAAIKDRLKAAELLAKRYHLFDGDTSTQNANAIAAFVKAMHPTPGELAALYAQEQDDGE